MLEDYKEKQPLFYNQISKIIKSDKISHAYLIETNDCPYGFDIAMSLSKSFLCPKKEDEICSSCNICLNIDTNNYPDLKIIETDSKMIKKEQLLELQKEFSVKPLYGKYLIYIIKNAELLNKSSANTILKFLEEPSPNIIAILLTNNIYNCLDTIISRCQVLSLINEETLNKNIFKKIYEKTDKKEDFDIFVEQEIKNIIDFYKRLEQDKTKLIAFYDITNLTDKIDILFDIGIKLYIDILNYKLKRNLEYFENYIDDIKNVSDFNEIGDIIRKIEIINDFQSKSSYNVNRELFVNNFIITFSGGNL